MNPVRPQWFYTYILISQKDGKFYTGVTNNLNTRLEEHRAGLVFSTKHRLPVKLIYFEACLSKDDAYPVRSFISNGTYCREKYLKTGIGKKFLKNRLKGGLTG